MECLLHIFTGVQFDRSSRPVEGDAIVAGDCAKGMLEKYPDARYWGSCEKYADCTPIWANLPDEGMAAYVRLLEVQNSAGSRQ